MKLSNSNIETLISELCETLKGKLSCSSDALEYVTVGEYGLALEFLADWCIDAEPQVTLSAEEIMKFKEIGDLMGMQVLWIELLPILVSSEIRIIPKEFANLAREYIKNHLVENPERRSWLNKALSVVNEIENSV